MLRAARSVLWIEVVELAARDDLDNRKGKGILVAQHRHGNFHTLDELLDNHQAVDLEHLLDSVGDSLRTFDNVDAESTTLSRGLHNTAAIHHCGDFRTVVGISLMQVQERSRGNTRALIE